ncbi:hypothetical protein F511_18366 [Dorcoceras hygrometricum]|uniref:Uncharacterized protein n=1 Tax=Dorcoceras hygrometricum TaxID=472368 RepID=A0A2Z7C947_9LAMI|nr:hypothetical protein F511_18366 [Dorcoceras hygrometricum]
MIGQGGNMMIVETSCSSHFVIIWLFRSGLRELHWCTSSCNLLRNVGDLFASVLSVKYFGKIQRIWPALESLTRSARTDSPRKIGRNKFRRSGGGGEAFGGGGRRRLELGSRTPQNPLLMLNTLSSVSVRESRIQYLCDPQWFRDTASRGPTTIAAPESQFRTYPSDHDSIGYPHMSASGESSTTMHRLLHASGSHPIPPPDDPKTNQYNQDLGLIHSTNGNHLESPNEGSSIDHQVTIYLHAQNITMFPTNETWSSFSCGCSDWFVTGAVIIKVDVTEFSQSKSCHHLERSGDREIGSSGWLVLGSVLLGTSLL